MLSRPYPALRTSLPYAGEQQPARGDGSRSLRGSPRSAVFPQMPVLDPTAQLKRASRVSRSAASGRSPAERIRQRAARPLQQRRISRGSSTWRPLAAGFGRVLPHLGLGQNRCAIREALERSPQPPYSGPVSDPIGGPELEHGRAVPRRRWRRRCVELRRAWPLPSQAARPRSMRYRGWCKAARERRRRAVAARPRGSADSLPPVRRRGHQRHGQHSRGVLPPGATEGLTGLRRAAIRSDSGRTVRGGSRGSPGVGWPDPRARTRASRRNGGAVRREVTWGSPGRPLPGSGCGGSCTPLQGACRTARVVRVPSRRGFGGYG